MRSFTSPLAFVLALVLSAAPLPSLAQLYVNIGAPPLLPVYSQYSQPAVSVPNEIWMPGYWAWGRAGYYWVPGTWVQPPAPGLLYTPGYWNAAQNGYTWMSPYWAPAVGYYGGVNYGSGYYGNGYTGGVWSGRTFRYNTAVTNVNTTIIRNVYVNRTVVVRTVNRVSYYGGRGGLTVRPTAAQLAVARIRHIPLTPIQRQHILEAARNRTLLASVNHGRPPVLVVARPLSAANRPAGYHAVTNADVRAAHPAPVVHHVVPAPVVHHVVHHVVPAPVVHHVVHHATYSTVHHAAPRVVHHSAAKAPVHHAAPKPPGHPEDVHADHH